MTEEATSLDEILSQTGRAGNDELLALEDREDAAASESKADVREHKQVPDDDPAKPDVKAEKPDADESAGRLAALQSERAKRQELERELQTLRARPAEPAKPVEPEKVPDLYEDPKGYGEHQQRQFAKQLDAAKSELRGQFRTLCENAARARHTDYDEAVAVFAEAARVNPLLAQAMDQQPDPAEFAYKWGRSAKKLQAARGDLDVFEQQIREDERRKIAGAPPKDDDEVVTKAVSVPVSLNERKAVAGGGASEDSAQAGPTPLGKIVGQNRGG